ncbi:MAG: HK97 gp10 family phage protein [Betaproteobacteria bacterium]|nr:HK97 gp10 family phage protein [Betaproteobacteria bacterium]NCV85133.1 HK97 gp10 family phage protein [Oxalobacteraceae bacterium]NDE54893.1 HK97 gp10 family phage protein [Actinomycetota bacterium]
MIPRPLRGCVCSFGAGFFPFTQHSMTMRPMSPSSFWQAKDFGMARVQTVRIEGLAQLDRALRELPQRIANRGLRASVYAGAKVIRDEARSRAPKAAQSLGPKQPPPGTLKRSVIMKHIRELSGGGRQTFYVLVRHGKKYRNQGKRGNLSQDAWYWRFVEFGTRKMAARPFLRPALESRRREAVDAIKERLTQRIEIEAKALNGR